MYTNAILRIDLVPRSTLSNLTNRIEHDLLP